MAEVCVRTTDVLGVKTHRFSGGEEFAAFHACCDWLTRAGFSIGPMQRDAPIGVMLGDYKIAKWRNLTSDERGELHASISAGFGSYRSGPVEVALHPLAPPAAFAAFECSPNEEVAPSHNAGEGK